MKSLRILTSNAIRRYASTAATDEQHAGGAALWKKLFFFVAVPALGLAHLNAFVLPSHEEHRPEFVAFPYLRIRKKPFPWGDGNHSLFHSKNNALPDGYED